MASVYKGYILQNRLRKAGFADFHNNAEGISRYRDLFSRHYIGTVVDENDTALLSSAPLTFVAQRSNIRVCKL